MMSHWPLQFFYYLDMGNKLGNIEMWGHMICGTRVYYPRVHIIFGWVINAERAWRLTYQRWKNTLHKACWEILSLSTSLFLYCWTPCVETRFSFGVVLPCLLESNCEGWNMQEKEPRNEGWRADKHSNENYVKKKSYKKAYGIDAMWRSMKYEIGIEFFTQY